MEVTEVVINDLDTCQQSSSSTFDDDPPHVATLQSSRTTTNRTAKFTLNKEKQVQSLGADTKLANFEITINDDDKNVGIQCSSAFYQAIAKPVLCGLEKQTRLHIDNVSVTCNHIDYNRDRHGYEYNRVLHIILGGSGKHGLGKVTKHLHHTKRLIQMQGGARMPDQSTIPLWFLKSFIKSRFVELANIKHVDIKAFNKEIEELVFSNSLVNSSKSCSKCNKIFSQKSVPTLCSFCQKCFHKSCLTIHSQSCPAKRPATNQTPPSSSVENLSASKPPSSIPQSLTSLSSTTRAIVSPDTPLTSFNVSTQSIPNSTRCPDNQPPSGSSAPSPSEVNATKRKRVDVSQAHSLLQPALSVLRNSPPHQVYPPSLLGASASATPSSSPVASSEPALNPSATPFNPQPSNVPSLNNSRKNKASPSISPENAKIDFLNIDLNSAKTRIAVLESTIKDKEDSIKIQKEKIALLEQIQLETVASNNNSSATKTSNMLVPMTMVIINNIMVTLHLYPKYMVGVASLFILPFIVLTTVLFHNITNNAVKDPHFTSR